ncbi:MAG: four helix bundle protein, partial [Elusimicrobiota bacterium]|nr:four helix bundle protein [Elusimicrobiota bacterium]
MDIYKITEKYPKTEVYGLVSQLRRCAVSIPSNIAEGYRRQHKKEYEQFLSIALGSLAELETRILLSKDLNFLAKEDFEKVWPKIQEVAKMLSGLKKSIKNLIQKVKMAVVILLFALPTTLSPTPSYASGAGTTAANFLKVSMNARAIAMGGAFSALADDSGAVFANPAGLAGFNGTELGFGFTTYLQDSKMGNISYASDISGNRFGFGMTALSITGIERRSNDTGGVVGSLGDFGANDMAVSFAYASKDSFSSI